MSATITATTEVSPAGVPRVRLDIGPSTATSVDVYRTNADASIAPVRHAIALPVGATAKTIYDYEAPFDGAVSYYVVDSGVRADSAAVTLTSGGIPWLVHPGQPELSVSLGVMEWPKWTYPIPQGVFSPIGRKFRVVIGSRRQAPEGALVVFTLNGPAQQAMSAILADGVALLLKGTSAENEPTRWVSVGAAGQESLEVNREEFTVWTLPLIAVDAPSDNSTPPVIYADSSSTFFSYAQAEAAAPTYADRSGGLWKA